MNKKKKITLIISLIILTLILVIGGTLAYFGWKAEEESQVSVTVSSGTGSCTLKSDNDEVLIAPSSTRDSGRIIKLNAKQEMASKAHITWDLVVNEIEGLQDKSFIYELVNTTTREPYGTGNFANITNTTGSNTITFSNDKEKLDYNQDYEFTLYLWIDGANFSNPITMANQVLDFDISCSITGTDDNSSLNGGNS